MDKLIEAIDNLEKIISLKSNRLKKGVSAFTVAVIVCFCTVLLGLPGFLLSSVMFVLATTSSAKPPSIQHDDN